MEELRRLPKFVKLIPTATCDTDTTLEGLEQVFTEFRYPQKILSNNATYFNNDRDRTTLQQRNIQLLYTTTCNPRANLSGRAIQEILQNLKTIKYVINHTPNTELSCIPYTIITGNAPDGPWKTLTETQYKEGYLIVRRKLAQKANK